MIYSNQLSCLVWKRFDEFDHFAVYLDHLSHLLDIYRICGVGGEATVSDHKL